MAVAAVLVLVAVALVAWLVERQLFGQPSVFSVGRWPLAAGLFLVPIPLSSGLAYRKISNSVQFAMLWMLSRHGDCCRRSDNVGPWRWKPRGEVSVRASRSPA